MLQLRSLLLRDFERHAIAVLNISAQRYPTPLHDPLR